MKKLILAGLIIPFMLNVESITLDSVIEENIQNVVKMRNNNDYYKNSQSMHKSTIYNMIPSMNYSASKTASFVESSEYYNSSFTISKSVSLSNNDYFNYVKSIRTLNQASIGLDYIKKQVAYEIVQRYFSVVKAKEELDILKENLSVQKKIRMQTMIQFENNQKSLLDNQQSEIDLLNAKIDVKNAENYYAQTRRNFFLYIQKEDENEIFTYKKKDIEDIAVIEYTNLSHALEQAQLSLLNNKTELLQSKLSFLPSLQVSWNFSNSKSSSDYEGLNAFSDGTESHSYTIGLNYDFLNLLTHKQSHDRLHRGYDIEQRNFLYDKEQFEQQTKNSIEQYKVNYSSLQLTKKKLELAEKNLEIAEMQYNMGNLSLIDFEKARINLLNTKMSYTRLYFENVLAKEELNLLHAKKILGRW